MAKDYGPQETTAQMEGIAKQLERVQKIPPKTAQTIEQLVAQPAYDCDRVACDAKLAERNQAVRAYLAHLLATKSEALALKAPTHETHARARPPAKNPDSRAADPNTKEQHGI